VDVPAPQARPNRQQLLRVRVWDLPLRLFHWLLVACLAGSFVTVKAGWMDWHFRFGYAALTLIVFRILWGLVGPRYARFSSFLFGPSALLAYLRNATAAPRTLGHTPVGSLSVFALLAIVAVQASAGLFASDDIASEGPLARLVSNAVVERASWLHHFNEPVILGLVALHLLAILFYRLFRRQSLIRPMVVGDRLLPATAVDAEPAGLAARDDAGMRLRALGVAAIAAAAVAVVVNWPLF
jgi:cytochrome b